MRDTQEEEILPSWRALCWRTTALSNIGAPTRTNIFKWLIFFLKLTQTNKEQRCHRHIAGAATPKKVDKEQNLLRRDPCKTFCACLFTLLFFLLLQQAQETTTSDIMAQRPRSPEKKPVRVWVDGCFDVCIACKHNVGGLILLQLMHFGHANALRQVQFIEIV